MEQAIRPWTFADAPALAEALNNPLVQRNLRDGIPFPYTIRDAEDYIRAALDAREGQAYHFAITAEGKTVGSIGAFRKENIHFRTAELGYYIAQPYWGKGLATRAVKELCAHLFAHTDLLRVFAEPYAYNSASCRVLEKAGFQLEGVLRQNAVKGGEVLDMCLYANLKSTW